MAVPTSNTDRPPIRRRCRRTDVRRARGWITLDALSNQVWNRDIVTVPLSLNIVCSYRLVNGNFLVKIAYGDVERAAGEKISTGVVKARLGQLPVRGSPRKVCNAQDSNKHDKG